MANVKLVDPQGHVCDLVVQDQELNRFVARKLSDGWSYPPVDAAPPVDVDYEDAADEESPDSADEE
jgi:hypothetical protein